ncbi:DNA polymerase domain-containing protein [Haloquadratum walsbyi]|uniref:DNA-directed DNA polymerase n=1 Tax=Haloquadratum walsbyi J07HQW2 TaxID=1238425 RepID=U1PWD8_9EURY|nr:DNA polymerase domain-containing protein [Haloquadratum walsbyi]ERG96751.1 MAG: DNA polymerase elongation subunit, family B [Haloquadratum walsbyi J07HQW2]
MGALEESINTVSLNLRQSSIQTDTPSIADGGYQQHVTESDEPDLRYTVTEQELYSLGCALHDQTILERDTVAPPTDTTSPNEATLNEDSLRDIQDQSESTLIDAANDIGDSVGVDAHIIDFSTIYEMPQSHIARFLAGTLDGYESIPSHLTFATESPATARWYTRLYRRLGVYAQQQANTVQIANNTCDLQRLSNAILPHLHCSETIKRIESHVSAVCDQFSERSQTSTSIVDSDADEGETRQFTNNRNRETSDSIHPDTSEYDDNWDPYVSIEIEEITVTGTEITYDIETTTHSFVADDCLVHNCDDFDVPYFLDRMEVINPQSEYDLTPERFSRIDEVWRSGWGGPNIKGRVVFDLLYAYKRTQFTELESYRLDAVGELELDVGKERYPGDIGDLWEQNPKRLLEYNLRDVELCVEIDRKQDIIAFWDEVRSFVGCKLEDATTPGDTVDIYILHEAHNRFALPSKGRADAEDYEGGAVFDPATGVKEMVGVLDLKSLYPMAMTTINASPETKVDPQSYDGDTFRAPNGTHFRRSPDGIIREMIDDLLAEREEKKSLRNEHDPGESVYEQYDRQQTAVKVIMNCFTPDTDVLTPNGVRNIRELAVGDDVYSLNPETMQIEIKPVKQTHAYPDYQGDLVDIQTNEIDFSITPNHRMLVEATTADTESMNDYEFIEAGNLDAASQYELPHDWSINHDDSLGEYIDIISLLQEQKQTPSCAHSVLSDGGTTMTTTTTVGDNHGDVTRCIDTDTFMSVIGWYIATGKISRTEDGADCVHLQLSQIDTNSRTQLTTLLDKLGVDWQIDNNQIYFVNPIWTELLDTICGRKDADKHVPEVIFDASGDQKRAFFDAIIEGSESQHNDSYQYYTSSKDLRDDILRLCIHIGIHAQYSDTGSESWQIDYTETSTPSFNMTQNGGRSTAEQGVYCVTVADNHTLLAGRNGMLQWTGNSLYGVLGWDRFRLYDKEMGAAVTATGRDVIEHTADAASDLDKSVIYGDSVTGDRPVVVRDPTGRIQIVPIETLFELATAPKRNTRITADGAPTGSSGLPKERRHLDQWEALSLSDTGETEWQSIKQIIRHQTDKEILTLQHEDGESTTTRDHSYITADDGEYVETSPKNVDEPLSIPEIAPVKTIETIDIYQILTANTQTHAGSNIDPGEWLPSTDCIHANDECVWINPTGEEREDSTPTIQRHIDLTSDAGHALIRFLAVCLSSRSKSTVRTIESKQYLQIIGPHKSEIKTCKVAIDQLFTNVTTRIAGDAENNTNTGDSTFRCHISTTLAATVMTAFVGHPAENNQLPSVVYHLPDAEQSYFIQQLIRPKSNELLSCPQNIDDSISIESDFTTSSRELAAGVSMLLTQCGQSYSILQRGSEDVYTIQVGDPPSSECEPMLIETADSGYVYDLSVEANQNFVDGLGGLVLHNTDSVMLELGGGMTKQEAIEQSFEVEEYINDSYDKFAREELGAARHRFEIEFEKLYRRFFQAGKKKRYAGHIIWKENKDVDDIDITGFEYKRSDIAPITKEVQRRVIEMIVHGEGTDTISEYLTDIINDFESGNVPLEDIGIPGGIGKRLESYDTATAQVRGSKYANEFLGTNFGRGSKPKRVYLRKVHPSWFRELESEDRFDPQRHGLYREFKRDPDVICFEYEDQIPDEFAIDWDLMLEKTLKGPIERIIEALGMSWKEVKSGQEQTGLGSFT